MNNMTEWTMPTPPSLDGVFGWIAVTLLSLSGALFLAEAVGLLPDKITRWINRNRLAQTISILEAFGIDIDRVRKRNRAASLVQTSAGTLKERVSRILSQFKLKDTVIVGRTFRQAGEHFHDIMGATSNPANARLLARDLIAKWREVIVDPANSVDDRLDFVATPKAGSPLLGAAFAEIMHLPIALHADEPKFESASHQFQAMFDCATIPNDGARALVVDDSSTGGGKVIRLIQDLRSLGYCVDDVLIVFEPQLKVAAGQNAAERLAPLGIRLHSIVKT